METDAKQVADLYRRYGPALYRRSLSLLGVAQEAEDIVQETFYQFWRNRQRFRGQSSLFTYLYRVTTNLSIDRLRQRKVRGTNVDAEEQGHGLDSPSPEGRVIAKQTLVQLLDGQDSDTVLLAACAYLDRMTQDEIAEVLGFSRRTIGKRLKRFIERVRTVMPEAVSRLAGDQS
jgi:RNA polymerase sigma-70 factor, ECF subfamily